jgi:hypothetical protein
MDLNTAVAGAAGRAFSVWMPLDSFAPITLATAATAAGPSIVRAVVDGALTLRAREASNPEFYAVIASLLRRILVAGDFGAAGLHAVSLPTAKGCNEVLVSCLQSLDREMPDDPLFDFAACHLVEVDAVLAGTCAVVRRHRHTLRRLKVPLFDRTLRHDDAAGFADALAECTAITSLDFSFATVPFRSWQHLGSTLHTLTLAELRPGGTDTTFRLLADNMPALREFDFLTLGQPPSQDGFIELVSRLRCLSLQLCQGSWASVSDPGEWPLTLPNLEELEWCAGDGPDVVAVMVLRRALSLRAVHASHASALAAIEMGPVAGVGDGVCAPLATVQGLKFYAVATDAASLSETVAASPRASAVQLRWNQSASGRLQLRDLFDAAAASTASVEKGAGWRRVRRVRLDVDFFVFGFEPEAATQCVLALFPRARYASWGAYSVPDVQLLPEAV